MNNSQLLFNFPKAYIPAPFIFCPLPLREPKKLTWSKITENAEMSLTSKYGVPSGKWGRLSLSLLCTEALKTGSSVISFGNEKANAIRLLGQNPNTGSNHNRFLKSMLQLSTTMLTFEKYSTDQINLQNVLIVKEGAFIKKAEQENKFTLKNYDYTGVFELSSDFFKLITEHSVPLDWGIYRSLQPLEQDIYSWMIRRYYVLESSQIIPWDSVISQFSDVDMSEKSRQQLFRLRKRYKDVMEKIKAEHYHKASFDFVKSGIRLNPSPLSIKNEVRTIS